MEEVLETVLGMILELACLLQERLRKRAQGLPALSTRPVRHAEAEAVVDMIYCCLRLATVVPVVTVVHGASGDDSHCIHWVQSGVWVLSWVVYLDLEGL